MWKLSWVIRMGPEFNHMYFYKREAQGDVTDTEKAI